jgi:hypothetical protein
MLDHLANQYARANKAKDTLFAKNPSGGTQDIGLDGSPQLAMPILMGRNEPSHQLTSASQPTVRLKIHVERSAE